MTKTVVARTLIPGPPTSTAIFSDDMLYRYVLERVWAPSKGRCAFIGLNPSTADEMKNDPTVARCINYAKAWGYGALVMLNAFALRSTDPQALYSCEDPVGTENDKWIIQEVGKAAIVVAAWGTHCKLHDRHQQLIGLVPNLHCLGVTKEGFPRHPLYLKKTETPVPFNNPAEDGQHEP